MVRLCCNPAQALPRALRTFLAGPAALQSIVPGVSERTGATLCQTLSCVCIAGKQAVARCCAGDMQLRPELGASVLGRQAGMQCNADAACAQMYWLTDGVVPCRQHQAEACPQRVP